MGIECPGSALVGVGVAVIGLTVRTILIHYIISLNIRKHAVNLVFVVPSPVDLQFVAEDRANKGQRLQCSQYPKTDGPASSAVVTHQEIVQYEL